MTKIICDNCKNEITDEIRGDPRQNPFDRLEVRVLNSVYALQLETCVSGKEDICLGCVEDELRRVYGN